MLTFESTGIQFNSFNFLPHLLLLRLSFPRLIFLLLHLPLIPLLAVATFCERC